MNTSAIVSFLQEKVSAFRNIFPQRLQALAEGSRVGSFEASETVMHEGDEATHFGVTLGGTIQVSVVGDGATRQSLGFDCSLWDCTTISTRRFSCCSSTERSPGTNSRVFPYPWV